MNLIKILTKKTEYAIRKDTKRHKEVKKRIRNFPFYEISSINKTAPYIKPIIAMIITARVVMVLRKAADTTYFS